MPAAKHTSTSNTKPIKALAVSALAKPAKKPKVTRKGFREAASDAAERYKGSMQVLS